MPDLTMLALPIPRDAIIAVPSWRSFRELSPAESAFLSAHRLYEHSASLEVTCMPGRTNFALTESTSADVWRWAVCCSQGVIRDEGSELTRAEAKRVAAETQRLWFHRCSAGSHCRCAARSR